MLITKTNIKKLSSFIKPILLVSIVAQFLFMGQAFAAPAGPGCYQQVQGDPSYTLDNSLCAGQKDQAGNPIDPTANCYLQTTLPPGVFGPPSAYKQVDCSTIDSSKVSGACPSNTTCLPQDPCNAANKAPSTTTQCQSTDAFRGYLDAAINFLAIGVGVISSIMIVIGGIQYITAGGNPQGVAAAKKRIINALIAVLAFVFMYALLQFIIPGGIF